MPFGINLSTIISPRRSGDPSSTRANDSSAPSPREMPPNRYQEFWDYAHPHATCILWNKDIRETSHERLERVNDEIRDYNREHSLADDDGQIPTPIWMVAATLVDEALDTKDVKIFKKAQTLITNTVKAHKLPDTFKIKKAEFDKIMEQKYGKGKDKAGEGSSTYSGFAARPSKYSPSPPLWDLVPPSQ